MTPEELAALSCGPAMPARLVSLEAGVIRFCRDLGQLIHRPVGFVAWFRVGREHVDLVARGDFDGVQALSHDTLTGGPVLVVADAAGPGAAQMVRRLSRLPGVEELMAIRRGRVRRHRVRRCRG